MTVIECVKEENSSVSIPLCRQQAQATLILVSLKLVLKDEKVDRFDEVGAPRQVVSFLRIHGKRMNKYTPKKIGGSNRDVLCAREGKYN